MQILLNPQQFHAPVAYVRRDLIPPPSTPWQRVIKKFDVSIAEMARLLNRDRKHFYRVIAKRDGLIHPNYQILLIRLAKARCIDLRPEDLVPEFK